MSKVKIKVAFQMNDINKISIDTDSTFPLIIEAYKRNYLLYYYNPENVSLKDNQVITIAQLILKVGYTPNDHVKLGKEEQLDLNTLDVIWLRQDPPFDLSYLTSTYFLDYVINKTPSPLIFNNPTEVRNYPEKIAAHYFSQFMPKTIITRNKNLIIDFLSKQEEIVIKPLYDARGNNVYLLSKNSPNNETIINQFLTTYKEPFIVQKFLKNIILGDKRVLFIDGNPEGVFARIPKNGILSNLAKGGKAEPTILTSKEKEICTHIGSFLKKHNLLFAGVDLIDEHLTEINLTSPTGLMNYYQFSKVNLAPLIWDKILQKLLEKTN